MRDLEEEREEEPSWAGKGLPREGEGALELERDPAREAEREAEASRA